MGRNGPLDVLKTNQVGQPVAPMLHLNLTVPGVLSPDFTRLAASCARAGVRLGVEISLIEALIDGPSFAHARSILRDAGFVLVLDGISHQSLLVSRPGVLQPDLLKLDWSPRLQDLPEAERIALQSAMAELDPARIVLHRAETEAALRWGVAQGIRRFQGRHVDAMLGAARIMACPRANGCTLRQCVERAASTGAAGRSGCHNTFLLDSGAAEPGRAAGASARPPRVTA
jgi:hypothetical protein